MGWRLFGLKLRISTLSSHWVAITFSLVRSRSDDIPFWTRPDSNLFDWMAAYRKISMSDGDSVGWKPCRMAMVLKLSSRRLPWREYFNGKCWRKTIGRTFKLSKVNKNKIVFRIVLRKLPSVLWRTFSETLYIGKSVKLFPRVFCGWTVFLQASKSHGTCMKRHRKALVPNGSKNRL